MSSVFSHFLRERSFKSRQNPRVDFFQARKDFEGFKTAFFHLLLLSFVVDGLFTRQVIRLEEAVWWTQRFLTWKIWPKKEVYLWQINLKANVCRNSTFQVNTRKNATWHTSHFFTEKNQVAREILRWYASRKHCITRLYIGKRYRVPNPCFTRIAMWPDNTSSWRQLGGIRGPLFSVLGCIRWICF